MTHHDPEAVVSFWRDAGPTQWFRKSDAFDTQIDTMFRTAVIAARDGALDDWRQTPTASLALIILLDQFPRNIFRGTPEMFASDTKAIEVAKHAIDSGHDHVIDETLRAFVYMPFMHAESTEDQAISIRLFEQLGAASNIKHAYEHADIINQFGRFPHRNAILGRVSSPQELAFLESGGFSG